MMDSASAASPDSPNSDSSSSRSRPVTGSFDVLVFLVSSLALVLFIAWTQADLRYSQAKISKALECSTKYLGTYWQVLMLATFVIAILMTLGRSSRVRMGGLAVPQISTLRWIMIILCTLMVGGSVFWAVAEPIMHFSAPPVVFGKDAPVGDADAAYNALSQTFMHWGFLAWAMLGSLTSIIFMYLHHQKGLPLKPRLLLYPLFGDSIVHGPIGGLFGALVDICCALAVMIGTVSSLGLWGIQAGAGLDALFGISGNFTNQLWLLLGLVVIYTLSAKSGAVRGIQFMSCVSVLLGGALALFILTQGPSDFVLKAFPEAMTGYAEHFLAMSMLSDDSGWLDSWTLFYWGWFIGYAPLMGMFVARISRGRTIRQMILVIAVLAPLVTCLWFTILGGSGLAFELLDPGSISDPMSNDLGVMAGVFGVTQQLPYSTLCAAGFLLLFILTMAIKSDAMILALSMVMTGNGHPENVVRIPIGLMIGLIAAFLVLAGGFSLLSPVSVIIAVPISLLLLPSLWYAPFIARRMAREQGI